MRLLWDDCNFPLSSLQSRMIAGDPKRDGKKIFVRIGNFFFISPLSLINCFVRQQKINISRFFSSCFKLFSWWKAYQDSFQFAVERETSVTWIKSGLNAKSSKRNEEKRSWKSSVTRHRRLKVYYWRKRKGSAKLKLN